MVCAKNQLRKIRKVCSVIPVIFGITLKVVMSVIPCTMLLRTAHVHGFVVDFPTSPARSLALDSVLSQASTSCKTANNSHSVGRPRHSSSPRIPRSTTKKKPIRLLNVNCQSVANKKKQFHAMIEETKPVVIVGTESWLRPDIKDTEIFPPNFTVYRRDRDTRGDGVFTAVSDHLLSSRQEQLEISCEMIWTKIKIVRSRDLYVCSYYRPDAAG